MSKEEINKRIGAGLDRSPYLDLAKLCPVASVSVAMGRAIVRKPQVFLMDEPCRTWTRAIVCADPYAESHSLQRELGVTTLYVTHDQTEALTMGDRIAVLAGSPLGWHRRKCTSVPPTSSLPAHRSPAMNLGTFTVDGEWAGIGPAPRASVRPPARHLSRRTAESRLTRPGAWTVVDEGVEAPPRG